MDHSGWGNKNTRPTLLVKMDPKFHSFRRLIYLSMFRWLHCPLPIWSPALPTLEFNRHSMSPTLGNTTSRAPRTPHSLLPTKETPVISHGWKRNQKFNKAHIRAQWDSNNILRQPEQRKFNTKYRSSPRLDEFPPRYILYCLVLF